MKTMKFVVIVALFASFSFLSGCGRAKIAKPSDIEVRITAKPANLVGPTPGDRDIVFRDISYEGSVINTGFQIAPFVKIRIDWIVDAVKQNYDMPKYGEIERKREWTGKCGASNEEVLKNLRSGETRQVSGIMKIRGLDGDGKKFLWDWGNVPEWNFERGILTHSVDILPQEFEQRINESQQDLKKNTEGYKAAPGEEPESLRILDKELKKAFP